MFFVVCALWKWKREVGNKHKSSPPQKKKKDNFVDMVVLFLLLFYLVEWIVKLIPFISRTCKLCLCLFTLIGLLLF